MLTHEQTKTAYELLDQADAAFDAGDEILGSRKLWEAFADTMDTIARKLGLPPCRDDYAIQRLLAELAHAEWDADAGTIATIVRTQGMPIRDFDEIHKMLAEFSDADRKYQSLVAAFSVARRFREAPARGGPEDYEVEIFRPEMPCIIAEIAAMA